MEINGKTKVVELIKNCPEMERFFAERGMYCRTCKGNVNCTLKKVAYYYGLLPLDNWLQEVKKAYKRYCARPRVVKAPE